MKEGWTGKMDMKDFFWKGRDQTKEGIVCKGWLFILTQYFYEKDKNKKSAIPQE